MPNKIELLYLRRNPYLKLIIPFVLGIIAFRYFNIPIIICNGIMAISTINLSILLIRKEILKSYKLNYLFSVVLSLFLITFGYSYSHYYKKLTKPHYVKLFHSNSILEGIITETPQEKNKSFATTISIRKIYHENQPTKTYGDIKCYFPKDEKVPKLGDVIIFQTKLNKITSPRFPNQFNYKNYLKQRGIIHSTFLNNKNYIKLNNKITPYLLAKKIRSKIIEQLYNTQLNHNEIAIIAALFLGEKQLLNQDIKSQFSDIGAMHVLAVSGLHVGILLVIISFILNTFLGKNNNTVLKVAITLFLIWTFAFLTGLSVSVLRASLMFSLIEAGRLFYRKISIYNIITVSAFILLIFNPQYLFDIGFQLSYLAVLGIIYFYPKINNLFYIKNRIGRYCWNITSVSIAAQIATIPLSIYYFHQIPLLSLVSNIFVSVYAVIIIVGGLLLLITLPFTFLFKGIAFTLYYIIDSLLLLVNYLATIPFSKIDGLSISEGELLSMIVLTILLIIILETKKLKYINLSFTLIIILIIQKHLYDYDFYKQQKITFINTENTIGVNVTSINQNTLITSENDNNKIDFITHSLSNYWLHNTNKPPTINSSINKTKNYILEIGSVKVLILNSSNTSSVYNEWFDFVFINNKEINLNIVKNQIQTNNIILSNSFSSNTITSPNQVKESEINSFHVQNNPSFDL